MEAKATYYLPPNFSTPPPPGGPFHLGTVLQDFETKEQMRPLNQRDQRIAFPEKFSDHKGGFTATRERLKSGELGIWAKFMGLHGVGGEASISAERSDFDIYEFETIETEFFYPSPKYISDCLRLTDVEDYLKGSRYKKPVYLVTGIKVGRGVNVRMDKQTGVEGRLELGVNKLRGVNLQLGPTVEGKMKHEPIYMFTESSDIVVGIQCIKIYHEKSGCLFGKKEVASEYVTSGAAFYSDNGKEEEEEEDELISFVAVRPDNYNTPRLVSRVEGAETWMLAAELETSFHHGSGPELPPAVEPVLNPFSVSPDDQCKQAPNLVWPVNSPYEVWHPA